MNKGLRCSSDSSESSFGVGNWAMRLIMKWECNSAGRGDRVYVGLIVKGELGA